jgi:two-component system response regulator YesN
MIPLAYTLIIVDDEEHIREGLSDLVDWASLGFRVVAKLEDGDQALDWLHKTGVDIIRYKYDAYVRSGAGEIRACESSADEDRVD